MYEGQHCACYDMEHYFVAPDFYQPCKEHMKSCPAVYTSTSVNKCKTFLPLKTFIATCNKLKINAYVNEIIRNEL